MIGGNYDDNEPLNCTTPMFSGLSNLGMNDKENEIERPPKIDMDKNEEKEYLRHQGITG